MRTARVHPVEVLMATHLLHLVLGPGQLTPRLLLPKAMDQPGQQKTLGWARFIISTMGLT